MSLPSAQPGVNPWVATTSCVSVIAANLRSSYPSQCYPGWIKTEWRLSSRFSFQVGKILVILWAARLSQFLAASESWLLGKYVISSTTLALQTPSQSNHLRWSHNPAESDTFLPPGSSIKLGNIDSSHHISTKNLWFTGDLTQWSYLRDDDSLRQLDQNCADNERPWPWGRLHPPLSISASW